MTSNKVGALAGEASGRPSEEQGAIVLEARDISRSFTQSGNLTQAVRPLDLKLYEGECFALVGESGSGKSTLGRMVSSLLAPSSGKLLYRGRPFDEARRDEGRAFYRHIQVVFQDPVSAVSPRMEIGDFIAQGLLGFGMMRRAEIRSEVVRLLEEVGLGESYCDRLPSQLSGGELQRAVIARAISVRPDVIVLDEATSALDVSVQRQILTLLSRLRDAHKMTYLFITHDLAVARLMADRTGVMYRGQLVELIEGRMRRGGAHHPYTEQLLSHALDMKGHVAADDARTSGISIDGELCEVEPGHWIRR